MTGSFCAEDILHDFSLLHPPESVPDIRDISRILHNVQEALDNESPVVRPRSVEGVPGGLVLLKPWLPVVIVPDLHARTGYLNALIRIRRGQATVLDALLAGQIQIVCVGDGFHSEARGARRWKQAWQEYRDGFLRHEAMDEEMAESLSLMLMVMILKTAAPEYFHFIKGNHENVTNSEEGGNRSFGKYAWEGVMVRDWFVQFLGEELLFRWSKFEHSLPLLAVGGRFMVSHAEPREFYSREEVISGRNNPALVFDFTWTGNGESREGTVEKMLAHYLGEDDYDSLYFGGHRPVSGPYSLRAGGRYVQIHNPERNIAVILEPGRAPNPRRDIRAIEEWEASSHG